ncbi:MAG TPA: hypothetical protein VFF78_00495 [Anaerolineaceae bacterium]|nr:hypothetical protein [Anaerolineaceae bacterium]
MSQPIKIIAYILAAILLLFGILFIWGAFSPQGQTGWILVGVIMVAISFGLIFFAARQTGPQAQNVTVKIDLPGDVNMETIKCKSCGGTLAPENIKLVAGAPVVTCPYCNTTYQITEEPKW